ADVPGCVIPDEQPGGFPQFRQAVTAPLQKLRGNVTDRTPRDKAQPHLVSSRIIWGPLLPQHTITTHAFRIGISLLGGLFDQAKGMIRVLPGIKTWQGKTTPPDLVQETDGPCRLLAGPGDQSVTCVFFCW